MAFLLARARLRRPVLPALPLPASAAPAARAAWAPRAALSSSASSAARPAAAAAAEELPAMLNTKRDDALLSFKSPAAAKGAQHLTSYFLGAGIPAALVLGEPVSTVVDFGAGLIIPLHAHIGMRGVIIDYIWDVPQQRLALLALAGITVLTAVGLTKFNLFDVGLTGAIRSVYTRQPAPAAAAAIGGGGKHH